MSIPVLIGPITKPAYNVEAVKRHTGGPIEACIRCLLGVDFSFSFTSFSSTEPSKHCLTFKLFDSQNVMLYPGHGTKMWLL